MTGESHNVPARPASGLTIISMGLTLLGVVGLAAIVTKLQPTPEARLLLLAALFTAVTGIALPFVWFLSRRFSHPDAPPATSATLLSASLIVGLLATALVWLRMSGR